MSRRVSLPGADELFRTTGGRALQSSSPRQHANGEIPGPAERPLRPVPGGEPEPGPDAAASPEHGGREPDQGAPTARTVPEQAGGPARRPQPGQGTPTASQGPAPVQPARRKSSRPNRRPSGRERHDEKITVYVSAEELMDLEHARLVLRGEHGLAVDRGRIVREAVAVVLADLEARGDASILVRRLRGR
ncbi:hypothetical protein [Actinacidiphila oryziradicis]|uniref:Cobyrinic acid a,c-diamide synthase n=1 Tax=Actinacidiphila oryziradicis TaxID=2571141 RepID=A0A4U0T799_9ACTN|nr:hypothetical protein [Actinacidiphila oryziradicis]TKA08995.1 hypothetical protein FCI23_24550 [Actinacidiphila oryziradicis]